jgi:signal transduction histidine kinase
MVGIISADLVEPILGAWLLVSFGPFRASFHRLRGAVHFIIFGALLSTAVGATVGITGLYFGGAVPLSAFGRSWLEWWVPNVLSDLVLAPLILTWTTESFKSIELILEFVGLGLLESLVFLSDFTRPYATRALEYLIIPLLIAFLWRWRLSIATLAVLLTAGMGIAGTYFGKGPFIVGTSFENLIVLQLFLAVGAIVVITLSAAISEQQEALRKARNAIQVRDDFLSIASHELNTPLTSLKMQIQFLRKLIDQGTIQSYPLEKLGDLIRISDRQITRFAELVKDLLDVSRISASRFSLYPLEEVDLSETVRSVVDRYRGEAAQANSTIQLDLQPGIRGPWDKSRLDQVVVNLLSNAIKYGAGKPIEIKTETFGACAYFSIRDYGIGIPHDAQNRIFERFERAASSDTYGGLGLGLYISNEIVRAHGGTIRVQSESGKGATFAVELPFHLGTSKPGLRSKNPTGIS